jgi:hypothetical protein
MLQAAQPYQSQAAVRSLDPSTYDPKLAAAEAKAAKARAKALRPWYKKKRTWIIATVLLLIGAGIAGGSNSSTSSGGSGNSGVSSGLGANDASGDVTDVQIGSPDILGLRSVTLQVTNHSSKRSDYVIDLSVESADGATQYDTTTALVNNVEPGQTANPDAFPLTKRIPDDAVVKVKTVERTASL